MQLLSIFVLVLHLFSSINATSEELVQKELRRIIGSRPPQSECGNGPIKPSLALFDQKYVKSIVDKVQSKTLYIVSYRRKFATAWISRAALLLQEGDFVECGCFSGGTAGIMMKVLIDFDRCDRKMWVFDSFIGLPEKSIEDQESGSRGAFSIRQEVFEQNLKNAGVYDPNIIRVTKGFFNETVPVSPIQKISFLRIDANLYKSTMDALNGLYERVVPGGYIFIDNYGSYIGCHEAVNKFRRDNRIYETIHYVRENDDIDGQLLFEGIWWAKRTQGQLAHLRTKPQVLLNQPHQDPPTPTPTIAVPDINEIFN